ncbi:hypothetical protein YC2023_114942 [Brassica napus]
MRMLRNRAVEERDVFDDWCEEESSSRDVQRRVGRSSLDKAIPRTQMIAIKHQRKKQKKTDQRKNNHRKNKVTTKQKRRMSKAPEAQPQLRDKKHLTN